jgi:hypothetical protein
MHPSSTIRNRGFAQALPKYVPILLCRAIDKNDDAYSSNRHNLVANHAMELLCGAPKLRHSKIAGYPLRFLPIALFVQIAAVQATSILLLSYRACDTLPLTCSYSPLCF